MSWAQGSANIIYPLVKQAVQEKWDMATLKKRISEAYPYGSRSHTPYKQWLKVQKEALVYAERMGVK